MRYFLLEIATVCGLAFVYGNHGPYIYDNQIEAQNDVVDDTEEGIVEVYLEPNGEINTDFYDWSFIREVLALNGFSEDKYKKHVKLLLFGDKTRNS